MAGASFALAVAACRDVLVGDVEDVASELCAILADCEPVDPDCATLAQRFRLEENDDVIDSFLRHHARQDCLASCSNARACRDTPPICAELTDGCVVESDCCGATEGIGACRTSRCCAPLGAPCEGPDDCCGGEACVDSHCGEVRCALRDETCARNTDCCSRLCVEGTCAAKTCSDFGESCVAEADCCDERLTCRDGVCSNPIDTCDACLPVSDPDLNCCLATGLVCYVRIDETSFCGPDEPCAQAGVGCGSNGDCCTERCEDSVFPHCCSPSGTTCEVDVECCEPARCQEGVCL